MNPGQPVLSYWSVPLLVGGGIVLVNGGLLASVLVSTSNQALWFLLLFGFLCVVQFVLGVVALVQGIRGLSKLRVAGQGQGPAIVRIVVGPLLAVGGAIGGLFLLFIGAVVVAAGAGGAWGRPLRVRGKQLHPELKGGSASEWTRGARPSIAGLDAATRTALEALWLHDAQKEHASVPAFSRVAWLLAAVGAPARLLEGAHRAALEEIDHAQRCFALAAGYGARNVTVEPMPDLLLGGLDTKNPLVTLAVESLQDGCLLEDFNADVAASCAAVCEDPATRDVLERIAREERSHADFSWAVLEWVFSSHGEHVAHALRRSLDNLERIARPTSATPEKQALVERADPAALRRHGRLTDVEWAEAWRTRLEATRERAERLFGGQLALAA